MSISVVIAENHCLVRRGLLAILDKLESINIIGEVSNDVELSTLLTLQIPNIIIIDYLQQNHFSLETIEIINKEYPTIKFLVITTDTFRDNILKVIELGAISLLTKECDEEEIINSLNSTIKGEKFICHKIIDIILNKPKNYLDADCQPINLSNREIEIIQQNALGLTAKEIGEKLFISTHTVYTHKKNIMKKLHINSSSELILFALKNGIIMENQVV